MEKFHFDEINLSTAEGKKTFVENLRAFEKELIKAGVDGEEIQKIIEIILGKHPKGSLMLYPLGWRGGGWKIHLCVKPRNQRFVYESLSNWLYPLWEKARREKGIGYGWKYLHAVYGKEFTIYVGSWDNTVQVVRTLEEKIGGRLDTPIGESLLTDMPLGKRCMVRFDTFEDYGKMFRDYGFYGIPVLLQEYGREYDGYSISELRKRNYRRYRDLIVTFVFHAYEKLQEIFGPYFTGTSNQVYARVLEFRNYGVIVERDRHLAILIAKS